MSTRGTRGGRVLPVAAAAMDTAVRHASRGWPSLALGVLRAGGSPARRAAGRLGLFVPQVLAAAAGGDRPRAHALLAQRLERSTTPRDAAILARLALTLQRPDLAERALTHIPAGHRQHALTASLVAEAQGRLEDAEAAVRASHPRRAARLATTRQVLQTPPPPSARGPVRPQGSRLRVLHVVTNSLPDIQAGYTVRTQGLALAQRAAGLDVHVATRPGFPVDIGRIGARTCDVVDGVPYHRLLPTRPARDDAARFDAGVAALGRLLDELRPDVIHAHSRHDNARLALAAAAPRGTPVIYEVRGLLEETWRTRGGCADTDYYRLHRDAEAACMRAAAAVITLGGPLAQECIARGASPERTVVVGNAVPSTVLQAPNARAATRKRLGIDPDAFVIGSVSTLNPYEGFDLLLRAADLANSGHPGSLHVLLAGDGPHRADLQALASTLDVPVTMPGRVPHSDVPGYLDALDVFAVPRRSTPVTRVVPPLKPLEALARHTPLLTSDLPPLQELLGESGGGHCVAGGSAQEWADAITSCLTDPLARECAADSGQAWVAQQRTWDAAAGQVAQVYARVTGVSEQEGGSA